jgi:hypothetical protein
MTGEFPSGFRYVSGTVVHIQRTRTCFNIHVNDGTGQYWVRMNLAQAARWQLGQGDIVEIFGQTIWVKTPHGMCEATAPNIIKIAENPHDD